MKANHITSGNPRLHILNIMKGAKNPQRPVNGPAPTAAAKLVPKILNGALTRSLLKNITSQSARRNAILNGCGCGGACGCSGCKEESEELLNKGPSPAVRVKNQTKNWLITNKPDQYTADEALAIGETAKLEFMDLPAEEKSVDTVQAFVAQWLINNGYNEAAADEAETVTGGGMDEQTKKYLMYGGAGLLGAGLLYMIFKK